MHTRQAGHGAAPLASAARCTCAHACGKANEVSTCAGGGRATGVCWPTPACGSARAGGWPAQSSTRRRTHPPNAYALPGSVLGASRAAAVTSATSSRERQEHQWPMPGRWRLVHGTSWTARSVLAAAVETQTDEYRTEFVGPGGLPKKITDAAKNFKSCAGVDDCRGRQMSPPPPAGKKLLVGRCGGLALSVLSTPTCTVGRCGG